MPPPIDPAAFEAQVLMYLDALYAFVLRRVGHRQDAEDVLQEALIRAWKKREQVRAVDGLRAWLYQVVINSIHEHFRRRGRRGPLVAIDDARDTVASDGPSPLDVLLTQLTNEQLGEALRMVPEDFAMAVELADLERRSYREIAALLDIPMGTVMSRIYRGRRLLADVLLQDAGAWGLELAATRRKQ